MGSKPTSLLIACIKCGSPSLAILETRGEYSYIIVEMLDLVVATLLEWKSTKVSYLSFDAGKRQLPLGGALTDLLL